jgi:hypothetical protein
MPLLWRMRHAVRAGTAARPGAAVDDAALGAALGSIQASLAGMETEVRRLTGDMMRKDVCAEHGRAQAARDASWEQRISGLEARPSRWWGMAFAAVGAAVAVVALLATALK